MAFDYGNKVRALLAMADDESLSEEARESYRAAAMRIMRDYQIAEEEALAVDPTVAHPITVVIEYVPRDYVVAAHYPLMAQAIAKHTGCRVHTASLANGGRKMTVVGYEGDVRYFEFLWTSAHLMFVTRIDPVWDDSLPEATNIFRMRQAGLERKRIADRAWGDGAGGDAKNRSKVQRIYLREAARIGEEPTATGLGFKTDQYRPAYAQDFVDHLSYRMRRAKDAADSVGGGLELHGRKARVDEAFYEVFPNMRPNSSPAVPYVAPNADCERCKASKSGFCRGHGYLKPRAWTKTDEARWESRINGASARAGRAAGRRAAEGVVLRGTTPRADRVDSGQRALEN